MSSRRLKRFYREYSEWLNNDAPEDHPVFSRCCGLCSSLDEWRRSSDTEIEFEMKMQFIAKGLDPVYPFNKSRESYCVEGDLNLCHRNVQRRNWVFDHAK